MKKGKKGFTLVELLAAVVILGLLSTVAVISISKITNNAKEKTALATAKSIITSATSELMISNKNDILDVKELIENGSAKGIVELQDNKVQAYLYINNKNISYKDNKYEILSDEEASEILLNLKGNDTVNNSNNFGVLTKNDAYVFENETNNENFIAELNEINNDRFAAMQPENSMSAEFMDNINNNSAVSKAKVMPIASLNSLVKYYNLNDEKRITAPRTQGKTNLCWAYVTTGAVESNILTKYPLQNDDLANLENNTDGLSNPNLSEIQLDYITAYDGFQYNQYAYNPFSGFAYLNTDVRNVLVDTYKKQGLLRKVGDGGNYKYSIKALFSGLTLQNEESFNIVNKYDYDEKPNGDNVANPGKVNYVVKEAEELSYAKSSDDKYTTDEINAIKDDIKNHVMEYGGVATSVCITKKGSDGSDEINFMVGLTKDKDRKPVIGSDTHIEDCTMLHGGLIIGWDDDFTYRVNNKTHKGAWIVKNSWNEEYDNKYEKLLEKLIGYGGIKKFFYVGYDADTDAQYRYFTHLSVRDTEKYNENWKKTYSSLQMNEELYNPTYKRVNANIYFQKNDNDQEIVNKVSYYDRTAFKRYDDVVYVLNVENINECDTLNNMYDNIKNIGDNKYEYNGKQYTGFSIDVSSQNFSGYKTYDTQNNVEFNKNYCAVLPSTTAEVTLFTSPVHSSKGYSSYVKTQTDKYFVIETASTGYNDENSMVKFDLNIQDEEGNNVINDFKVENNILINNINHIVVRYKKPNEMKNKTYYVKVGNKSDQVLKIDGSKNTSSSSKELCSISADNYKIKKDGTVTVSVKCKKTITDKYVSKNLKKYVSDNGVGTFEVQDTSIEETNDERIFKFVLKAVKGGSANVYIDVLQTTNDKNYFSNMLISESITVLSEPVCNFKNGSDISINVGETKEVDWLIKCTSYTGINMQNAKEIEQKFIDANNENISIEKFEYIPEAEGDILNEQSLLFQISEIKGVKEGETKLTIPSNFIINNENMGNDVTLSDFNIKVTDKKSSIDCHFKDEGLLLTAKLKKGSSKTIKLVCSSNLKFSKLSPSIIATDKNIVIKNVKLFNTYEDNKYNVVYDVNITGKKIGFSSLKLNANGIQDIKGVGNKTVKSSSIWIRLLGK